jgi:hypothetical protein
MDGVAICQAEIITMHSLQPRAEAGDNIGDDHDETAVPPVDRRPWK